MKYIERINLIDITNNTNLKKEIKNNYNKGSNYYEEVESKQHPKTKD